MLVDKVLVLELSSVDRLSTDTGSVGEVTSLKHKLRNDSVENASLEVKGFAGLAHSLLSSAKSSEVLGSLGDGVGVQLHDDTASRLIVHGDIEENLGVWHCCVL